jgi:hypothetical protein
MKLGKIDTRKSSIVLNYQLFAEPNADVQDPNGHPSQSVSEMVQELLSQATDAGVQPLDTTIEQPQEPQQQQESQTQKPVTGQPDTEPTQVSDTPASGTTTDPYEKRYKDAQAWGTKLSQENALLKDQAGQIPMLRQQIEELRQQIQAFQQPQMQQQTQPQEDLTKLDPQAALDKLYENPIAVIQQIAGSQQQQPVIDPNILNYVQEQMIRDNWNKAYENIMQMPDFAENQEAIMNYINDNGLAYKQGLDPNNAFKDAYLYARKINYKPPQPQKTQEEFIQEFLQNPENIEKYIVPNQDIEKAILAKKAAELQQTKTPISIASDGGGQPVVTPVRKPTTIKEVKSIARSILSGNNG